MGCGCRDGTSRHRINSVTPSTAAQPSCCFFRIPPQVASGVPEVSGALPRRSRAVILLHRDATAVGDPDNRLAIRQRDAIGIRWILAHQRSASRPLHRPRILRRACNSGSIGRRPQAVCNGGCRSGIVGQSGNINRSTGRIRSHCLLALYELIRGVSGHAHARHLEGNRAPICAGDINCAAVGPGFRRNELHLDAAHSPTCKRTRAVASCN